MNCSISTFHLKFSKETATAVRCFSHSLAKFRQNQQSTLVSHVTVQFSSAFNFEKGEERGKDSLSFFLSIFSSLSVKFERKWRNFRDRKRFSFCGLESTVTPPPWLFGNSQYSAEMGLGRFFAAPRIFAVLSLSLSLSLADAETNLRGQFHARLPAAGEAVFASEQK